MLTFVMTDIHGCYNQLNELINRCERYGSDKGEAYKFVFLGDYVDRGPDSKGVLDRLMTLKDYGHDATFLMGNHEDLMLHDQRNWLYNGGTETEKSYPDGFVSKEHLEWCRSLKLYHEDEFRIYVHAGLSPYCAPPEYDIAEQNKHDLIWIRDEFLLSDKDFGKLVVHGHTPYHPKEFNVIQVKPNRINLDTGCVFGGYLTCAVFNDKQRDPIEYLQVYHPKY